MGLVVREARNFRSALQGRVIGTQNPRSDSLFMACSCWRPDSVNVCTPAKRGSTWNGMQCGFSSNTTAHPDAITMNRISSCHRKHCTTIHNKDFQPLQWVTRLECIGVQWSGVEWSGRQGSSYCGWPTGSSCCTALSFTETAKFRNSAKRQYFSPESNASSTVFTRLSDKSIAKPSSSR